MPARKSVRLSRTDKESSNKDNHNDKRKRSDSKEFGSGTRKAVKKSKDGRMVDTYCWNCHKVGHDEICSTCPRVYHSNCILKTAKFNQQDVCPECQLQSVDGTIPSAGLTVNMMNKVLVCLIRRLLPITTSNIFGVKSCSKGRFNKLTEKIPTHPPELMMWPQKEYKTCKPIDLSMLIETIKSGGSYSKTVEFFSDVKWIYHNCYKFFGAEAEITKAANKIVKAVKNELLDIEACYECYYKYYNEIEAYDCDPFSTLCEVPHTLLWGKLKGHPFWPSKCLKVIDGMAQIQFFGTHDKNSVPAETCYLMSRKNPTASFKGRKTYDTAIMDLGFYIQNYERKYGPYLYAAHKVKFFPADDWHWIKKKEPKPSTAKKKYNEKSNYVKAIAEKLDQGVHEREFSNEVAVENEDSHISIGGDSGPNIIIASVRRISNNDVFLNDCESQSAQNASVGLSNFQNASNSCSSYASQVQILPYNESAVVDWRSPTVCITRLDESVYSEHVRRTYHPANSQINPLTSEPVSTSLQSCDESTQNAHNSLTMQNSSGEVSDQLRHTSLLQGRLESSTQTTSAERSQARSHFRNNNAISLLPSNDHKSPVVESSSNEHSRQEIENIASQIGIKDRRVTDPESMKLVLEGGTFIKQSGQLTLQYSTSSAKCHDIVCSLLKKLKTLDSAINEEKKKENEYKSKFCNPSNPLLAQVINGTKKMMEEQTELGKKSNDFTYAISNTENLIIFKYKEKSNLHCWEAVSCRSIATQTDVPEQLRLKYEEEMAKEKLKFEQQCNRENLEIRSKFWCVRCKNLGSIYCCWSTFYCTEECRALDFESHRPSCRNIKAGTDHTVLIEEISGSEFIESNSSKLNSSPEPIIDESSGSDSN